MSRRYHALVGVVPDSEIARRYGITPGTVRRYRHKLGIAKAVHRRSPLRARLVAWLGEQWEPVTATQAATAVGSTRTQVWRYLPEVAICVEQGCKGHKDRPSLWVGK